MNLLTRYLMKQVIMATLIVLLVLLAIESFIELSQQLKIVGRGDFTLSLALLSVPLILFSKVYQLFPMAALLGSLIGLGRLASNSELIVMRASGMSAWQMVVAVMLAALLLIVVVVIPGEAFAPQARDYAMTLKTRALTGGTTLTTSSGTWVRDGRNFIHIKTLLDGRRWQGVTRYQFDEQHRLRLASYADSGTYRDGAWQFKAVQETHIFPDHTTRQTLAEQTWPLHFDPTLLGLSNIEPEQQSLVKLYRYIQFRKHSGQGAGIYEFAFWRRLLLPLSTLVMILLAVPVIYGPLRSVTMGLRIVAGVMIGFSFYILNQFLGPFSLVYQVPPLIAAALPTTVFGLIGLILLSYRR